MAVQTRNFPVLLQHSLLRPATGLTKGSSKFPVGMVGLRNNGDLVRDLLKFDLTWGSDIYQVLKAEIVWTARAEFAVDNTFFTQGTAPKVSVQLLASAWPSTGGQVDNWGTGADPTFGSPRDPAVKGSVNVSGVFATGAGVRTLDVTNHIGLVAPATVKRANGSPGGGDAYHGWRVKADNESTTANRWLYQGMRHATESVRPILRLTFEDNVPPEKPVIESPADGATVASGGGGRLQVDYLFVGRAGDTNALSELEVYGAAATDAVPGTRLRTTGAIVPTARAPLNAYSIVLTDLPRRTAVRFRLRTMNQKGSWGPFTELPDGDITTAYVPGVPLDPLMTSDPADPHIFLTLNSQDPQDYITGFTGQFYRHNPDGTTTNLWPSLTRIDVAGGTVGPPPFPTRADIPWGGVQLIDGDRVSWRGALYNRDGVVSPLTGERTVTMRTRSGPTITPADTGTKLTSRTGPVNIADSVEFDAIRYLLYRDLTLIHDSGQVLAGPDTDVDVTLPADLIGWGETIGIEAQTRPTGTSVFGPLSSRSYLYFNSLPTTTLTASDGDGFSGAVLPTRDVLWTAPYTDPDAALHGETPDAQELELRAGATPRGSGALYERRGNVTPLEDEHTGRRLDALTSTTSWPVDTDVTATTAATQPSGYSGNSASVQATGGSSSSRGARSTVSTADLDLSTFGDGTLIRIWRRITSNTNLTRWVARVEFATTSDYAEFDLAVTGDAVDTWVEKVFAKGNPARTNGTVDWSLWSGKVFYRVVVSGAYTGSMHVRDLRIGSIATDKDTPDGGVTWESTVDARRRYRDDADPKVATTLAANSAAGATNVKVTAITDLAVGDSLTILTSGIEETRTIATVGTAGSGGTGVTVTEAYTHAHLDTNPATVYHWGNWTAWQAQPVSQPPTVAVVSPGGDWTEDAFGRTETDTWGSADSGGAWTLSGTAANYDVAGGKGTVSVAANTTRIAALLGASIRDTDVRVTFRTDKVASGSTINVAVLARASAASDTSYFRGRARMNTSGVMEMLVEAIDGGSSVGSASATVSGLTHAIDTDYTVRMQAIGANPTLVRARLWLTSEDEPTEWHVTLSDSTAGLQDAGSPGVRPSTAGIDNAPVLFSLDDFRAAAVVIDPTVDLVHSFASPASKAQAAVSPILYRRVDGVDELISDTLVTGAGTTNTVGTLTLAHDTVYAWEAVAYDTDGLSGTSERVAFLTDFSTPNALPVVLAEADARVSAVTLDWSRTLLIGASTAGGPSNTANVEEYEAGIEYTPLDIVSWFLTFGSAFPTSGAEWCRERGSIPMIAWEAWDGDNPDGAWQNVDITSGSHDADIDLFAQGAAAWGGRVLIRLFHEMNGGWVPWGLGNAVNNGNTPATFVAAWRYVVERCRAQGATNIEWVWCPNVDDGGGPLYRPLADIYPGDDVVDWTAMDGYNFGSLDFNGWEDATTVFGATYDTILELAPTKPVMIAETGSAPTNGLGDRVTWIENMKNDLPDRCPRIVAVVYFEFEDTGLGIDWQLLDDATSLAAWVDLVDTWTDPDAIVDPYLDHFRVYRQDPATGQDVRIDGGPAEAGDGLPKLTAHEFVDHDAHLGLNRYRVTVHNGALESDAAYVDVFLSAARGGSWMLVTAGQERYTFPFNPTTMPRVRNGTIETFRVPGSPYAQHLHWGASTRSVSLAFAYLPLEDGQLNVLIGEMFDAGQPFRIKAPEGYLWSDMDVRLTGYGPETPMPHGFMEVSLQADEVAPDDD